MPQEQVAYFEIAVDYLVSVQVLKCLTNLLDIALYLKLPQPPPPLQQLIHGLVLAVLQQYVNVVFVFEKMLKLHNIRM